MKSKILNIKNNDSQIDLLIEFNDFNHKKIGLIECKNTLSKYVLTKEEERKIINRAIAIEKTFNITPDIFLFSPYRFSKEISGFNNFNLAVNDFF